MKMQLFLQYLKKHRVELIAEKDINSNEEMRAFVKETQVRHPIKVADQKDIILLACNENSHFFKEAD